MNRSPARFAAPLLAFAIPAFLAWAGLVLFLLYRTEVPYRDSWAYFSPAVFARFPGDLTMPLMGGFDGADKTWGLHWPGVLLLKSLVLPFLPHDPLAWIATIVAEWAAVALLAAAWLRRTGGTAAAAVAVAALLLVDRLLYQSAYFERGEFVGALLLLGAAAGAWSHLSASENGRPPILSLVCFFLLPLVHPVCLLAAGGLLACFGLARIWSPRPAFPYLAAVTGAFAAGVGAFFLYFAVHPGSWHIFRTHVAANVAISYTGSHARAGRALLELAAIRSFQMEMLYILLAFVLALRAGWLGFAALRRTGAWSLRLLVALVFLLVFACAAASHNGNYPALAVPFSAILLVLECAPRGRGGMAFLAALCLFLALYFPGKILNARAAGWPNPRREMLALREILPPARHILIPVVMWETARVDPGPFFISTLPFDALPENRLRYEESLFSRLEPGDLWLVDALQDNPPLHPLDPEAWEKVGERRSVIHRRSGKETGFDIAVWRKK